MTTTFKSFVNEDTLKVKKWEQLDLDEVPAIEALNKHCSEAINAVKNGKLLYRGDDKKIKYAIIHPSTGTRTSRDTNNIYQLMMEASEKMKDIPKRSKSLICTNSLDFAKAYGNVNVVIPFDGAKIAIGGVSDFLSTHISSPIIGLHVGLGRLGRSIFRWFDILGIQPDFGREKEIGAHEKKFLSIERLDKELSKIDPVKLTLAMHISNDIISLANLVNYAKIPFDIGQQLRDGKYDDEVVDFFKKQEFKDFAPGRIFYELMRDNPNNRFTAISTFVLGPEDLDLVAMSYSKYINWEYTYSDADAKEIWTSDSCVLINIFEFKNIVKQLIEQGFPVHPHVMETFGIR